MDYYLWCFCCCNCLLDFKKDEKKNALVVPVKIEEIHQYIPFEDVTEQPNIYYEALKLKQKLDGQCKDREKKVSNL